MKNSIWNFMSFVFLALGLVSCGETKRNRFEESYTISAIRNSWQADSVKIERVTPKNGLGMQTGKVFTDITVYNTRLLSFPGCDTQLVASGIALLVYNNYEYATGGTSEKMHVRFKQEGGDFLVSYSVGEIRHAHFLHEKTLFYFQRVMSGMANYPLGTLDTSLAPASFTRQTFLAMDSLEKNENTAALSITGFKTLPVLSFSGKMIPCTVMVTKVTQGPGSDYLLQWYYGTSGEYPLYLVQQFSFFTPR